MTPRTGAIRLSGVDAVYLNYKVGCVKSDETRYEGTKVEGKTCGYHLNVSSFDSGIRSDPTKSTLVSFPVDPRSRA